MLQKREVSLTNSYQESKRLFDIFTRKEFGSQKFTFPEEFSFPVCTFEGHFVFQYKLLKVIFFFDMHFEGNYSGNTFLTQTVSLELLKKYIFLFPLSFWNKRSCNSYQWPTLRNIQQDKFWWQGPFEFIKKNILPEIKISYTSWSFQAWE